MQQYILQHYTYTKMMQKHNDDKIKIESAIIAWLIQNTSIRIGHDKDEDIEADTVGASTLCVKNMSVVTDGSAHKLNLDFMGKDSIQYKNSFVFNDNDMYKRLKSLLENRDKNEKVFTASANDVNAFLQTCIPEISAKIFRPTLGTSILVSELKKLNVKSTDSTANKLFAFNKANIKTAELLNHKRAASKNFDESFKKMEDNLKISKDNIIELKSDITKKLAVLKTDLEAAKKVFEGKKLADAKTRIKDKKEKLEQRLERAEERIINLENKLMIKKDTKETAVGTSRGSYISPKVIVSWAKDVDLPVEKLYTKSLLSRFSWALNTSKDYWKTYTI
jgi:DNA topoisomerase-1